MPKVLVGKNKKIEDCKVGEVLASDVVDKHGSILVSAETKITDKLLDKIKNYNIEKLNIVVDDKVKLENEVDKITDEQKENFKELKLKVDINSNSVYKSSIKDMKDIIEDISEKNKLDVQKINKLAKKIYKEVLNENSIISCIEILNKKNHNKESQNTDVAVMAGLLGKWLEISNKKIYNIILAAILKDIGLYKVGNINNDSDDYKKHPFISYGMILRNNDIDLEVKKIVLSHHENSDGSGYPFGLMNYQMPLGSKILQVADRFVDYLIDMDKSSIIDILKRFYENEITNLDYKCLKSLVNNILWNNLGRHVKLSDDSIGEIVYINKLNTFKPLIKTKKGVVDLSLHNNKLKIIKVI